MPIPRVLVLALAFCWLHTPAAGQDVPLRIVTYYLDSLTDRSLDELREPLRKVLTELDADILLLQALGGAGVDPAASVVRTAAPRLQAYSVGGYMGRYQALFFDESLVRLISSTPIGHATDVMTEWELELRATNDTLFVFGLQFPHGGDTAYVLEREHAATRLWDRTTRFRIGRRSVVIGHMGFRSAWEYGYQNLVLWQFTDLRGAAGAWHADSTFARLHTASTRMAGQGDQGLIDRDDFILVSPRLDTNVGIRWLPETYSVFGNDGLHFGRAVNDGPNSAVSPEVANALYALSSHLPVMVTLIVPDASLGMLDDEPNYPQLHGYPNPAAALTTLEPPILPNNRWVALSVVDYLGSVVGRSPVTDQSRITVDLSDLPNGLYWCRLTGTSCALQVRVAVRR